MCPIIKEHLHVVHLFIHKCDCFCRALWTGKAKLNVSDSGACRGWSLGWQLWQRVSCREALRKRETLTCRREVLPKARVSEWSPEERREIPGADQHGETPLPWRKESLSEPPEGCAIEMDALFYSVSPLQLFFTLCFPPRRMFWKATAMPIRRMAGLGGGVWAVMAAVCAVISQALKWRVEIEPHKMLSWVNGSFKVWISAIRKDLSASFMSPFKEI